MERSIGIVEFRSIAIGIGAVDTIVKTSDVRILDARTICPGKYYIIFAGKSKVFILGSIVFIILIHHQKGQVLDKPLIIPILLF